MNDNNRRCSRCEEAAVEVQNRQVSASQLRWHGDDEIVQLERVEGICRSCDERQTWYEPMGAQRRSSR